MAQQYIFTFSLLAILVGVLLVLALLVWAWSQFLDKYEHDPGRVRAVMAVILMFAVLMEITFAWIGVSTQWAAWISVGIDLWGGLDALLRFPASHTLESFFTCKQVFLLVGKTCVHAFGMTSLRRHVAKLLVIMCLNVWCLPLLYLMALPLDPKEQLLKDDAYDVDLAARVWQLAVCRSERRQCIATCRTWWNRRLVYVTESSRIARLAICAASPAYRRSYKREGRSV